MEGIRLHPSGKKQPGTTTIIRRVQSNGTDESWEQFVRRYEHVIIEYAMGSGLRRDHAEDLRQTVLLELVTMLPTLTIDPERGSFRSILRTMVKRRCIDFLRRHYRENELKQKIEINATKPEQSRWDRAWQEGLMKQALSEAAEQVNPETFQAFELTTISSVPPREVAKLLGMSVDSVYQSKSRVKAAVEKHYARLCNEAENREPKDMNE